MSERHTRFRDIAMADLNDTSLPGHTEAKALLLLFCFVAGIVLFVFVFDSFPWAAVASAYALPVLLVSALLFAVRLCLKGTARVPVALGAMGVLYIAGGATFDMVATVIHTPALDQEANLIARTLLDSGHSTAFLYAYAAVAQTLFILFISTLWLALLRHRETITALVVGHGSPLQFIKAATGGARLTWRQWMIPFKLSELPHADLLLWLLVVGLVSGASDRWFLGLEWFQVIPSVRWLCVGSSLLVGFTLYFAWLWHASHKIDVAA